MRQLKAKTPKFKQIFIGWKHRYASENEYQQQRVPIGGTQKINLDTSVNYTVFDIIEIAIKSFETEAAILILSKSDIVLGFNNNKEISSFSNINKDEIGLWNYLKINNMSSTRIHFYLLSTSRKENYLNEILDNVSIVNLN